MTIEDLLARLMTEDELATSRVATMATRPIRLAAAEVVTIDPLETDRSSAVSELIVVDMGDRTPAVLPTAVRRMARDGLLVAEVPVGLAVDAAQVASSSGADWVALIDADDGRCRYLVAAVGIHPAELGPIVSDELVHPPSTEFVHVPQNRFDRGRRRLLRREGRARLNALARRLRKDYGDEVSRVVDGIVALAGDCPAPLNAPGSRPAIFLTPGLPADGWPDPDRWPRLRQIMDTCERYGAEVRAELLALIASRSFHAYVEDSYNADKFRMKKLTDWQSLSLYDAGQPTAELPSEAHATRAMLAELAPHISGEVALLRLAPMASLQPHHDDNDYQQTVHLGLSIPPDCAIRAGGDTRTWEEGRPLVFSPSYLHEVWNRSQEPRDILLIDIWHMDLAVPEVEALTALRRELTALRQERSARLELKRKELGAAR